MASRIAGIAYVKRDGVQYALKGNFTIGPLSRKKEGVAGMDGVHGYKETIVIPYMAGTVSDLGGLSVKGLQNITDSTITAELANGKVYVLRNAWYAGEGEINAAEGEVGVRFEGLEMKEITA